MISDRAGQGRAGQIVGAGGAICCASILLLLPYQSAQILLMPKKSTYSVHARHGAAADVLLQFDEIEIEFESIHFGRRVVAEIPTPLPFTTSSSSDTVQPETGYQVFE